MSWYPWSAMERARTLQAMIFKAVGGQRHWLQAAAILRGSARTRCRCKPRAERLGDDRLFDRRTRRPSIRRSPLPSDAQDIRLDREPSVDVDGRHCHAPLQEAQGIQRRDTWVQTCLRRGGLVPRRRR
jgi:hypothetical protein